MRRDRWMTLAEVSQLLLAERPELGKMSRKARVQYTRRLLRRVEQRNMDRYSRVQGNRILVSRNAIEFLRPHDGRVLAVLEQNVASLAQNVRLVKQRLNAHGSRLRVVEEKQRLTTEYLAAMQGLDGLKTAS